MVTSETRLVKGLAPVNPFRELVTKFVGLDIFENSSSLPAVGIELIFNGAEDSYAPADPIR